MINWVKNIRLNASSAFFVGITLFIGLLSPFFYMFLIPPNDSFNSNSVSENIMTILLPTFINFLIIPAFKITSFYQNIDENLIKDKDKLSDEEKNKKIKTLNEKQIVFTEAILTFTTALPIVFLYIYKGTYILAQKQPEWTLGILIIITFILAIIGVWALIKKFRR